MDAEQLPLNGNWDVTIMMIVVASWILYKYAAPRNFKEWRNVGLIQAFIVALYAEMYGFPLTIYILGSVLGVNIPWLHINGHLWSVLFDLGHTGAMVEMFIGYGFIFGGLFLLAKGWQFIYRVRNTDELVTDGPYRYVRHPQYSGIFFALFGQLIHWPTLPTLILFPVIVWAYYHLSRKEEKAMLSTFKGDYSSYKRGVPMFFPGTVQWRSILEGK